MTKNIYSTCVLHWFFFFVDCVAFIWLIISGSIARPATLYCFAFIHGPGAFLNQTMCSGIDKRLIDKSEKVYMTFIIFDVTIIFSVYVCRYESKVYIPCGD